MHPILIKIGPITLYTYGFLVAVGFLAGIFLAGHLAKKSGIPHRKITDMVFWVVVIGLVGSRLLFIISEIGYFIDHPLEILAFWKGGLVFYGGFLAGTAAMFYFIHRAGLPTWKTLDIMGPVVPLGHFFGRLGCFFAGCCYGKPTSGPLGVVFTDPVGLARPLGVPLIPTQLIEAGVELVLAVSLLAFFPRKRFHGQVIILWFIGYSTSRFFLEFFRGDPRGFIIPGVLSSAQGIGIVLFGWAVYLWIRLRRREAVEKAND